MMDVILSLMVVGGGSFTCYRWLSDCGVRSKTLSLSVGLIILFTVLTVTQGYVESKAPLQLKSNNVELIDNQAYTCLYNHTFFGGEVFIDEDTIIKCKRIMES